MEEDTGNGGQGENIGETPSRLIGDRDPPHSPSNLEVWFSFNPDFQLARQNSQTIGTAI